MGVPVSARVPDEAGADAVVRRGHPSVVRTRFCGHDPAGKGAMRTRFCGKRAKSPLDKDFGRGGGVEYGRGAA